MGSGASTQNLEALELKDELLSLPEVQNIYGDQFDEYIFNTLKDENSLVKKSDLKNIVDIQTKLFNSTLTKATFDVFKHYSGNTGEMKTRSFLDLCRDAKILKKAKFSSADASILYDKVLKKQRVIAKSLNYEMFRKDIVPAIAAKYDISDDDVLSKFGGVGLPSEEIFDESVREKEDTGEVTEQQSKAATKLQSITRQKSAAKEMEEMKKIMTTVSEVKDDFFSYPEVGQSEDKILDVFCTFCVDGVATKFLVVKLLQESKFLHQKRTIFDCKMAFVKTKMIAKTRGCYTSGVIANKFLRYRVFREVLLPCLAERFDCKVEEILESLRRVESNNLPAITASALNSQRKFISGASKKGSNLRSSFSADES